MRVRPHPGQGATATGCRGSGASHAHGAQLHRGGDAAPVHVHGTHRQLWEPAGEAPSRLLPPPLPTARAPRTVPVRHPVRHRGRRLSQRKAQDQGSGVAVVRAVAYLTCGQGGKRVNARAAALVAPPTKGPSRPRSRRDPHPWASATPSAGRGPTSAARAWCTRASGPPRCPRNTNQWSCTGRGQGGTRPRAQRGSHGPSALLAPHDSDLRSTRPSARTSRM